jgi:hypothetical protein
MINFNVEYFNNNTYFFLKDRGDKISLYYNVADTLTESRKNDDKKEFDKKHTEKVKKIMSKHLKKKSSKKEIDKDLEQVDGEVEEIVASDGSMMNSNVPIINQYTHPRKTMDQTVNATRITNDPIMRGYRVYWGESEEKDKNIVKEVDYSEVFGWEETKDMNFDDTVKKLIEMGIEPREAEDRAKQMGKLPNAKRKNGELKQRLAEKESVEEQRQKSLKIIEDILTKKSKNNADVVKKNTTINKILKKNLQSIKRVAEKEGISTNDLIRFLKTDE